MKLPSRVVEVMRGVGGAALIAAAAAASGCGASAQVTNDEASVVTNRSVVTAAKHEPDTAHPQASASDSTQVQSGHSGQTTSHAESPSYDEVPPPCGRG